MRRWDVSMPLAKGMPAFPGDPLYDREPVKSIARGDPYSVSRVTFGTHAGTHVDPPCHFIPGAATIDRIDLERLNGPCRVIGVPDATKRIGPAEVAAIPPRTERVLFRTANSARWKSRLAFFSDYASVGEDGARALIDRGVRLVGVDSLSVEEDSTGRFPVHHALLGAGALILEGLLLADVPPGEYEMHCLPLLLHDGDGGPARVVLTGP